MILIGLIVVLSIMDTGAAAPLPLTGMSGKAILAELASTNMTNEITRANAGDLWSWGKIPSNYALNQSGELLEISPDPAEDNLWLSFRKNELDELNTSAFD
jgi:hypothetical protein